LDSETSSKKQGSRYTGLSCIISVAFLQTLQSILEVAPDLPVVVLTGLADDEFGSGI
jgi:hypothetical protein